MREPSIGADTGATGATGAAGTRDAGKSPVDASASATPPVVKFDRVAKTYEGGNTEIGRAHV